MGSSTFTGEFSVTETLEQTDSDGATVEEALESIGYENEYTGWNDAVAGATVFAETV